MSVMTVEWVPPSALMADTLNYRIKYKPVWYPTWQSVDVSVNMTNVSISGLLQGVLYHVVVEVEPESFVILQSQIKEIRTGRNSSKHILIILYCFIWTLECLR